MLSDEIYSRLTYDRAEGAVSIYSLPNMKERVVLVDGFSKTYCMTGWRLGWAVMPEALARRTELLAVHSYGCVATFTQEAGVAALEGPQDSVNEMVDEYMRRRDFVVGALNDIDGVECPTPDGAFYAFPDVSSFGKTSKEIADLLLNEGGVAVLPGTDFGANSEGKINDLIYPSGLRSWSQRFKSTALLSHFHSTGLKPCNFSRALSSRSPAVVFLIWNWVVCLIHYVGRTLLWQSAGYIPLVPSS